MNKFCKIFDKTRCSVIGMIHVRALPGTPRSRHSVEELVEISCEEASVYSKHGIDGLLVENMHDIPYVTPDSCGPEVTSVMTRVCSEVRKIVPGVPCGVQLLAGNNEPALAVALAAGFQFVRVENFVFGHVADEGILQACAGPLLRYRKTIGADNVLVLTDVKKKHCSHSLTADLDIGEVAKAAEFFFSDGIIVTGSATGEPPQLKDILDVKKHSTLPVIIGSGVTAENANKFSTADAFIVGSHFKEGGSWENRLSSQRVSDFMAAVGSLRTST